MWSMNWKFNTSTDNCWINFKSNFNCREPFCFCESERADWKSFWQKTFVCPNTFRRLLQPQLLLLADDQRPIKKLIKRAKMSHKFWWETKTKCFPATKRAPFERNNTKFSTLFSYIVNKKNPSMQRENVHMKRTLNSWNERTLTASIHSSTSFSSAAEVILALHSFNSVQFIHAFSIYFMINNTY